MIKVIKIHEIEKHIELRTDTKKIQQIPTNFVIFFFRKLDKGQKVDEY